MPKTNLIFDPQNKFTRPRGCLYILQENKDVPIYKIGMSSRNIRDRLLEYTEGTQIILEYYLNLNTSELYEIESEIKRQFTKIFKLCKPSTERFEGAIQEIENNFVRIIKEKTSGKDITFTKDDLIYFPTKPCSSYQEEKVDRWMSKMNEINEMIKEFTEDEMEEFCNHYEQRKQQQIQDNINSEKFTLI